MSNIEQETPEGVRRDPIIPDAEVTPAASWKDDDDLELTHREEEEDAPLVGDRGISQVGAKFGSTGKGKLMGAVALLAVGAIAIYAVAGGGDGKTKAETSDDGPAKSIVAFERPNGPPPPPPTLGEIEDPILSGAPPQDRAGLMGGSPREKEVDPRVAKLEESRRAGILAYSSSGGGGGLRGMAGGAQSGGQGGQAGETPGLITAVFGGEGRGERNELERARETSTIGQSRARMLSNRNYLITAGTQIPCVLQTAMDTSTPGFVSCLISRDVYSDNGNVVLMEKGTRVLGEYRGALRRGQNRMFVVWNRAVTPKGVSVDLGSPAADALGRAGMSGDIETFFWQRFGGAILLSLVDDASAIASSQYDEARTTIRQPSDAASVALENSINIPPVLRKNQGELVSIIAGSDFNFSGVYGLAVR